jgi:hypothetical protein
MGAPDCRSGPGSARNMAFHLLFLEGTLGTHASYLRPWKMLSKSVTIPENGTQELTEKGRG